MHPESAPLWNHIAKAHESENSAGAALQAYGRALELNPWYGDSRSAVERLNAEIDVDAQ